MRIFKGGIKKPGIYKIPCDIQTTEDLKNAEDMRRVTFTPNGTDLNQWKYEIIIHLDPENQPGKYIIRMLEGDFRGKCFYQYIDFDAVKKQDN